MYKRKFPKTKTVENVLSQSLQTSSSSSLRHSTPSMPITSQKHNSDIESSESPSMLDDFNDFPIEKKRKIVDDNIDDTTDCSQPLFDNDDDSYSFLKQTLISCGLHLKGDQNILCELIIGVHICYIYLKYIILFYY